jgi:hypothetical protein
MNERSMLWAVTTLVAGSLWGCGQQPRYYRVAIDTAPLSQLPSSCYTSGVVPPERTTNVVEVGQWILWDGVEERKYLQVGDIDYELGDAYRLRISDGDALVSTGEEDKLTFTTERFLFNPTRTFRAIYTFDELGESPEGTLSLSSQCTGTGCNQPNCEATLTFVGRRLAAEPTVILTDTGTN